MDDGGKNARFDPQAFLSQVDGGRVITQYQQGQVIYQQGDDANSVWYLQSGKAKVTVISETGKEAVVAFLGPGEFFGEGCLAGQNLRLATVTALADCLVTCIPKKEVL